MSGTGYRAESIWWAAAIGALVLLAATLIPAAIDRRLIDGTSVWAKPLKFELSLAMHFATLALVASALSPPWRASSLLAALAWASALCALLEIAYIAVQAGRQQASHFNLSTPLHAALYTAMAIGAVVITASAAVLGVAAGLDATARLGPATRWGVVLGLVAGTLLTFLTAFRMGAALGHHVGLESPGAARVPLTGWSLTVGDRRIPHFFATHMMQVLPVAGLMFDRIMPRGPAVVAVVAVAVVWTGLTLILFRQANAGLPPLRWPL